MAEESVAHGVQEPAEVRFSFNRWEWLRTQWPALLVWNGLAAASLVAILGAASRLSYWLLALLLVPIWYFLLGAMAVSLNWLVIGGRQEIVVYFRNGNVSGVSDDGGKNAMFLDYATFEDHGSQWLVVANFGRSQLPIPKAKLSEADRAFVAACAARHPAEKPAEITSA
jgi:hypothetical protein